MKTCSKCRKTLEANCFNKQSDKKDGLACQCRCCAKQTRQRWSQKNPTYKKQYYKKNKKRLIDKAKEYYRKNRVKLIKYVYAYLKAKPWAKTFRSIQTRCNNKNCKDYPRYGGRGIKNYLTLAELKYLWMRDKAYLMSEPSIDRINPNFSYSLENCRYIEKRENSKQNWRRTL